MRAWLVAALFILGWTLPASAQRIVTMSLENCTQVDNKTFTIDAYITHTGTVAFPYYNCNLRFNMSRTIIPAGANITTSLLSGFTESTITNAGITVTATPATITGSTGNIAMAVNTGFPSYANSPTFSPTNKWRLGRIQFVCSVPFATNAVTIASWLNVTATQVSYYSGPTDRKSVV